MLLFVVTYGFRIYGLPQDVTDDEFALLFQGFKSVGKMKVVRDSTNGQCPGYGFVNFADLEIGKIRSSIYLNNITYNNRKQSYEKV